jgi:hypothetical protein
MTSKEAYGICTRKSRIRFAASGIISPIMKVISKAFVALVVPIKKLNP